MNKRIQTLLTKKNEPIEKYLLASIKAKKINDTYVPFKKKGAKETIKSYVTRVIMASGKYQFVKVDFNGGTKYVGFGIPDSCIITEYGRFTLIPAQVVGGKWGVHYILIYPDLSKLKSLKHILIRTVTQVWCWGIKLVIARLNLKWHRSCV
jgi:hypothetical protein